MSFTVESKSQLAKLLASENLIVEHKKIPTAYFNLKTRTLACPIWKDMSGNLYDLLMGHEVGHALYTPEAGWHDALCEQGKNFKAFLNVIEDARIEKKIKRKYPGIKKSFVNAYTELLEKDFFGIKGKDLTIIPFIDKVNLFTKTDGFINFELNETEQKMMSRVLSCETWQDVVDCAKEIFEYSKDEQQSMLQQNFQPPSFSDDDSDEFGDYQEFDEQGDYENNLDQEMESESNQSTETDDTEESDDETDSFEKSFDKSYATGDFEPVCETDDFYRNSEVKLLDESSKEYVYMDLPKPLLNEIITPYNIVHDHITKTFSHFFNDEILNNVYREFRNKNEKYISLLAKEFEMKKAAKAYLKNKVSDTGDIDINKIYKYQVDDNIFKKVTIQPKGKSHGLILLLDHSGSMHNNMGASIEQVLVLSLFCKKVNIPFVVYAFTDLYDVRKLDYPEKKVKKCFEVKNNCLNLEYVYLREYLNSSMKSADFNRCVRNMTMLAKQFENRSYKLPRTESFGGTPLIESMVALQKISKKFQKENNLDIMNTVIVHDGDADVINNYFQEEKYHRFSTERHNVYINDNANKLQIKLERDEHPHYNYDYALKNAIFSWYKKTTGSKIYGFFIIGKGAQAKKNLVTNYRFPNNKSLIKSDNNNYYSKLVYDESHYKKLVADLKENKFVQSYNNGYDSFYLIPGGKDLSIENEELQVSGNVTKGKLKTAFLKMGKKKQTNRILVNKFIAGIS